MNEEAEDTIYKYAYVRCVSERSYESLQRNKVKNLSDLESYQQKWYMIIKVCV